MISPAEPMTWRTVVFLDGPHGGTKHVCWPADEYVFADGTRYRVEADAGETLVARHEP